MSIRSNAESETELGILKFLVPHAGMLEYTFAFVQFILCQLGGDGGTFKTSCNIKNCSALADQYNRMHEVTCATKRCRSHDFAAPSVILHDFISNNECADDVGSSEFSSERGNHRKRP